MHDVTHGTKLLLLPETLYMFGVLISEACSRYKAEAEWTFYYWNIWQYYLVNIQIFRNQYVNVTYNWDNV